MELPFEQLELLVELEHVVRAVGRVITRGAGGAKGS
jgi:hypothetical protein